MESTTLIILLGLLLALWLYIRHRSKQAAAKPAKPARRERRSMNSQDSGSYHAVSLKFPRDACAAAKKLEGQRFLSTEAPKLPLPECNSINCECRFLHHKDRRSGKDRRNFFTASGYSASTGKFEAERRTGADRREDEDEDFFR